MAKVSFTKLGLKINNATKSIMVADQEIEIKQYLPINDMKFYNVGKMEIFLNLEILYTYTNINFTEKQKEDVCKLFDLVESSGLLNKILDNIPETEINFIRNTILNSVENIYKYQNSIMGILDAVSQDYSSLEFDATSLQQKMSNPENLALLKDVMTRLG